MKSEPTGKAGRKKKLISAAVFKRELEMCQKLSQENRGQCNWGKCKNCGVVPLLYKLHQGVLLEEAEEIKKAKKSINF